MTDIPDNLIPNIFSRSDVEKIFKCTERSAQRFIKLWIEKDIVAFSHRKGHQVYYKKIVKHYNSYQSQFIDRYLPNKTEFLTPAEQKQLQIEAQLDLNIDFETFSIKLFERLLVDLSWASSQLEGNTFSLLETERLLLFNEVVEGKKPLETQMILNHKEAIKFITRNQRYPLLEALTFHSLHALLAENLLSNPKALGALRRIPVGITGTNYTPIDIPQVLKDEFEIFLKKLSMIKNPFEQALFVLIFIPYLQPYEDGNKRTSRVACNIPLLKNNLIPVSFKNIQRDEYIEALKDIYEKNEILKMKDLFIKAVRFSAKEYKSIVSTMAKPKDILIKYRLFLKEIIHRCVSKNIKFQKKMLEGIPIADQNELFEHIKSELSHLHEGQLVRFNLLPSEFKRWKKRQGMR